MKRRITKTISLSASFLKGRCLLRVIQKYFCVVYDYAGTVDFRKGLLELKMKIGGNHAFSEIIKQQ